MLGKNRSKMDAKLEETKRNPIMMLGKIRDLIRVSIGEEWNLSEYQRRVRASTGEGFGQVSKKGGLRASTREGSG